jgi:peptidoglycan/LPS O-acetylase OafA/YrhL
MRTLHDAYSNTQDSDNNFLFLRLIAATLVVYGHSFALAQHCNACRDAVGYWFRYRYSGDLGLHIFFVISGFLVTASFCNRKSLGEFVKARLLRIYPAVFICTLLMVFLGALLTTRDAASYWLSSQMHSFFFHNSTLRGIAFKLPGVFEEMKFGGAMNGSLWSLPVELRLYVIVAGLGLLGAFRNRATTNIVFSVIVCAALFAPHYLFFFKAVPANLRVGAFFLCGAALYTNRNSVPLHWSALLALILTAIAVHETPAFDWIAGAVIAYGVFFIAFAKKIYLPKVIKDYSYGIYLYAWPVQQLTAYLAPTWGPYRMAACSIVISWVLGALSWHLIERPALKLKRIQFFKALRRREILDQDVTKAT